MFYSILINILFFVLYGCSFKKNKSVTRLFKPKPNYMWFLSCGAYGSFLSGCCLALKTASPIKLHHIYYTCFCFVFFLMAFIANEICSDSCSDFFLRWEMYFILTPFTSVVVHFLLNLILSSCIGRKSSVKSPSGQNVAFITPTTNRCWKPLLYSKVMISTHNHKTDLLAIWTSMSSYWCLSCQFFFFFFF